jgi:hypothetical protein
MRKNNRNEKLLDSFRCDPKFHLTAYRRQPFNPLNIPVGVIRTIGL